MTMTLCYDEALTQFERELLTPVVPGELADWFDKVTATAESLSAAMWQHTETLFNTEYPDIAAEDPELMGQVEQLVRKDSDCLKGLADLLDELARVRLFVPKCEPDEAKMRNTLETFIQHGLQWIMCAKRQQKSRETWFAEALYRERGGGD